MAITEGWVAGAEEPVMIAISLVKCLGIGLRPEIPMKWIYPEKRGKSGRSSNSYSL